MRAFQSTRPHGARPCPRLEDDPPPCFNPRARTGRDTFAELIIGRLQVSIHAPARGATWDKQEGGD